MGKSWPFEEFREYVRALMDAMGIADYAELSRATGVSQNQFSNWHRGLAQPSRETLKKVAPALGVPPVLLYIQAGLDSREDLDLTDAPDLTVWPREFHQLHEVYESYAAAGRGQEALDSIGTLVLGLAARMGTNDQPTRRRRTA